MDEDGLGVAGTTARPLVWSKVQPPVQRRRVSRPALLELCMGAPRKVTLIRAPAGWGKSTLLADWHAAESQTRRFAWLALDRGDNDPVRFWTYLIEALRTRHPAAGTTSLPTLEAPRVDVVNDVLPAISAELACAPHRIVLVLDDYHLVTNPEIDESLAAFVDHLPPVLELAVATRSQPALPLARLRARGELVEIDGHDLGFSVDDATRLLNDLQGLGLDHDAVARLQERTEGWAAGLYLASLTLRGRADVDGFIREFAGDDRHVVDYLSAEVLAGQPRDVRTFLLRTSLLDRLCAALCDAVTERDDSWRILREMERSNFFLVPLDSKRAWYRYHHLFAELLRQELQIVDPASISVLHRRAAVWHRENGLPAEAIHHATAAGDVAEATRLILDHWVEARDRARLETILSWLAALPTDVLLGDPRLCLVQATTLQELGRVDDADRWLAAAERREGLDRLMAGPDCVATGVAACRSINQDTAAACRGGHRAGWRPPDHARHGSSRRPGRGRTTPAGPLVRDIEALLHRQIGLNAYYGAAMAHIARGALHQQDGQLTEADHELARGTELADRGDARFELVYGLVAHARLKGDLGDREAAVDLVRQARGVLDACADPGALTDLVRRAERGLRRVAAGPADRPYPEDLSDRELSVLRLLPSELTQREIAARLYVSFNTVKSHIKSIFRKLGVTTRADAVRRGRDLGLL